ncbi:DUF2817 domain-containing protein [Vibrio sp. CAU 1672]|uniref:DUF2817 domain-containing protein n=1 Tax=Vibrio sp. CAU 1672 TaxID=3032594 RepID=UPI0023DB1975|nr:DUF2817 domain-containing protein [Vibrio sp. CAU 1672]MDF2152282.1 DUF2817 domain-containing protein [Vibrio sp. CAU 1672]
MAITCGYRLLVIHAVNPYGMAYLRRFNEDNVDVNRNFVDWSKPVPENPEYKRLADVIAPLSLSFGSEVAAWAQLLWYRVKQGKAAAQAAISGGQYSHPKGLFYGGAANTWSNRQLRSIFQRYLSHAERVIVIDVHTGLGEFGSAEIVLNSPEDSPEHLRALAIWGPALVETTTSGNSVSAHLEASFKLAVADTLPGSEVTSVSLEYGTFPPMDVFRAMRVENWLYHYGGTANPEAAQIKQCMLRTFYPDSAEWKASVLNKGKQVIERALSSLESL